MQYSNSQIANLALNRIGARSTITSLDENSPNAVKVLAVWDHIFQEVLSERDWKFAKTRVELELSDTSPLYGYGYAWELPADFLRFVRPHKRPPDRRFWLWLWGPEGWGWYHRHDPPLSPTGFAYVVETLPSDGTKVVLCDYDGSCGNIKINYVRLITDYTQLMPGFVNALAYRLAAELSISLTEDKAKFELMETAYHDALNSAEAQNETMDYIEDESGSTSWLRAGRYLYW